MLLVPDLIVQTHVCLFFYNASITTCYVTSQAPTHRNIYLMTSYGMYHEPVCDLSSSIPFLLMLLPPKSDDFVTTTLYHGLENSYLLDEVVHKYCEHRII